MTDEPAEPPLDVQTHVTAADVPLLNRRHIETLAGTARKAGTGLIAIGLAGLLAWAWVMWRTVDYLMNAEEDEFPSFPVYADPEGSAGAGDYADAFAQTSTVLMFGALVVGIGVIVRLLAAHVGSVAGADVSDLAVGEEIPGAWTPDA